MQDELDKRLHVRGKEASLQYRINDVLLPDGLFGFGQKLSPRFVDQLSIRIERHRRKTLKTRLDVVNVFDTIYEIRGAQGIEVFAPEYLPAGGSTADRLWHFKERGRTPADATVLRDGRAEGL